MDNIELEKKAAIYEDDKYYEKDCRFEPSLDDVRQAYIDGYRACEKKSAEK
jgi:hypothetical protein